MPLFGHGPDTRRGHTGADGGAGGHATQAYPSTRHGLTALTTRTDTTASTSSAGGSAEEGADDGPLHKLTVAYHRSLEDGSSRGSPHSRERPSLEMNAPLVVREGRSQDNSIDTYGLHAHESRPTSARMSHASSASRSVTVVEATAASAYDLGLDPDDEDHHDYELVDLAAVDALDDQWPMPASAPRRRRRSGSGGSARLRDMKPWTALRQLAKSSGEARRHILTPRETASGGVSSSNDSAHTSIQGQSLSYRAPNFETVDDDSEDDACDDDDMSGSFDHGTPVQSRFRRVDLSVSSGQGADNEDKRRSVYDPTTSEVALLRLDDEFYTPSELAQWRRLQCDVVGAGFIAATPVILTTPSNSSLPSSLCARTATTTTNTTHSSTDAIVVMRTTSDVSNSVAPSDWSDGVVPVSASLVRRVMLFRASGARADDDGGTLPLRPPPSPAATATKNATPSRALDRWDRGALMEDAKHVRSSQTSEGGLTSCATTGGSMTPMTVVRTPAPPPQRRLSRQHQGSEA